MRSKLLACLLIATPLAASAKPVTVAAPPPADVRPVKAMIEIYQIAPGQQEAFLRFIARCDAVNSSVGPPPRQLYVHSDGAEWDFILIQPAETPPDRAAALDAAWKKAGMPSGADFFFEYRKMLASHTDTTAIGPTTASDYLATRQER